MNFWSIFSFFRKSKLSLDELTDEERAYLYCQKIKGKTLEEMAENTRKKLIEFREEKRYKTAIAIRVMSASEFIDYLYYDEKIRLQKEKIRLQKLISHAEKHLGFQRFNYEILALKHEISALAYEILALQDKRNEIKSELISKEKEGNS